MPSIHDALNDAFSKAEQGTLVAPVEVPIEAPEEVAASAESQETAEQKAERLRDERGRFTSAAADPATATPAAPVTAAPPEPVVAAPVSVARKAPTSWKKDYWGHWDKLGQSPDLAGLQEYIEEREGQYAKGVSTYKAQWDQAQPIYEAVQAFLPELQQHGIPPTQWIQSLGQAHRALALGSAEQKLQMFTKLATDYGVDLGALTPGGQPNPQFAQVSQTVNTLQSRTQQLESMLQQQEQQRLERELMAFKANAPHFEAVKETMGQLLQSGVVTDLQAAYDKAIRLNDDIWQQQVAQQQVQQTEAAKQADAQRRQAEELARKKAAAVSPKSSSPTGNAATGGGKQDRRAALAEAFDTAVAGRF